MNGKSFREIHMTGSGFRTLKVYRLFFAEALRDAIQARATYEADVREWYENGEGRPVSEGGSGYAYPECIHGFSLWTDYDNICGGCEDGSTPIQDAIVEGRTRYLRFNDRWDWLTSAPADLDQATRRHIEEWTMSLFPGMKG